MSTIISPSLKSLISRSKGVPSATALAAFLTKSAATSGVSPSSMCATKESIESALSSAPWFPERHETKDEPLYAPTSRYRWGEKGCADEHKKLRRRRFPFFVMAFPSNLMSLILPDDSANFIAFITCVTSGWVSSVGQNNVTPREDGADALDMMLNGCTVEISDLWMTMPSKLMEGGRTPSKDWEGWHKHVNISSHEHKGECGEVEVERREVECITSVLSQFGRQAAPKRDDPESWAAVMAALIRSLDSEHSRDALGSRSKISGQ
mmetsp:Transcript_7970/g.16039  ORF Transcript_7970/g.16039 Transcript_7970/m.16039 type:complete len:265 (+) Transcript_7970:367-1161(+)